MTKRELRQTVSPSDEPLILLLRAEFRRSAIYASIGIGLIPAIRWALLDFLPRSAGEPTRTLIPCVLMAVAPFAVLRWRLRVDSSGVSRRRILWWDLWPWRVFEQGKVKDAEGESTSYVLPEKPFWARKLTLELLEDRDRARVETIIDRFRVRPELDLPSELAVRYDFRKEALIAPDGLLLRDRGEETRYAWDDVQTLRIRRRDHRRRDFESLGLVLPGRVVEFALSRVNGGVNRSWSGTGGMRAPSAEVLAAFLERVIPADRMRVTSLGDAPLTVEEWQDRRSILTRKGRDLTMIRRIVWGASLLLFLLSLSNYRRGIFPVVGMMVISAIALGLVVIVMRYIQQDHREESARLEAQMPEH